MWYVYLKKSKIIAVNPLVHYTVKDSITVTVNIDGQAISGPGKYLSLMLISRLCIFTARCT